MQATAVGSSYLAGGKGRKTQGEGLGITPLRTKPYSAGLVPLEERVPWSWFCKNWKNCKLDSAASQEGPATARVKKVLLP